MYVKYVKSVYGQRVCAPCNWIVTWCLTELLACARVVELGLVTDCVSVRACVRACVSEIGTRREKERDG